MSRLLEALKQLQREDRFAAQPAGASVVEQRADRAKEVTAVVSPLEDPSAGRQFEGFRESLDRAEAQSQAQAERLAQLQQILCDQSTAHVQQVESIQAEIRRREQHDLQFQAALREEIQWLRQELRQRPETAPVQPPPAETVASPDLSQELVRLLRQVTGMESPAEASSAGPAETDPSPAEATTPAEPPEEEVQTAPLIPPSEAETAALADMQQEVHRQTFALLASRIRDDLAELAGPEEGSILLSGIRDGRIASQVALRLALACQRQGEEVLLIDGNCRGKILSQELEVARRPGLYEIASRQVDWPDTLVRLREAPIHLIPAGMGSHSLTATPSQRRQLTELLEDLSRWWSLILIVAEDFDAPSTALYGSVVSAGYLETGLGRTTDRQLAEAMRTYEQQVLGHLGIIVSNAPPE